MFNNKNRNLYVKPLTDEEFFKKIGEMTGNNSIVEEYNYYNHLFELWMSEDKKLYNEDLDNMIQENGINPLMLSAISGKKSLVDYSLMLGYDINAKTKQGITALMFASYRGNLDIIKMLYQAGAAPNIMDNRGYDSFMYSIVDRPVLITYEFDELFSIPTNAFSFLNQQINDEVFRKFGEKQLLDRYDIQKFLLEKGTLQKTLYNTRKLNNASALDLYLFNCNMKNLKMIDKMLEYGFKSYIDYNIMKNIYKKNNERMPFLIKNRILKKKVTYLNKIKRL